MDRLRGFRIIAKLDARSPADSLTVAQRARKQSLFPCDIETMSSILKFVDSSGGPLTILGICLGVIIWVYFYNNPLKHGRRFMVRRFINWFPLGMTYAFLYMGRYNLNVSKVALGDLMSKEDFGIIFAAGTWTYALSFLINGPLIDRKLGGKRGIMIAGIGAAAANLLLGVLSYLIVARHLKMNLVIAFSVALRAKHVLPELRSGFDHQGQGVLVSCAGAWSFRRDFRHADFLRGLFRFRLGTKHRQHDESASHRRTGLAWTDY